MNCAQKYFNAQTFGLCGVSLHVSNPVSEGHIAIIIETHKACLNVKATGARSMRVVEILTEDGKEVKEGEPLVMVEKA